MFEIPLPLNGVWFLFFIGKKENIFIITAKSRMKWL